MLSKVIENEWYQIYLDFHGDISSIDVKGETSDKKVVFVCADSLESDLRDFVYKECEKIVQRKRIET